jgi:hemoglobin
MARRLALVSLIALLTTGCMEGSKPEASRLRRANAPGPIELPPLTGKSKETLYTRLGGKPAITKVVDDLVTIVIEDPRIKDEHKEHFKKEDNVAELKKKLVDQIGQATGGPEKYTGRNMKDAHKGMKITDADFDALADDVGKALDKNNVGPKEKKELMDLLGPMRKEVVEKPEEKENP